MVIRSVISALVDTAQYTVIIPWATPEAAKWIGNYAQIPGPRLVYTVQYNNSPPVQYILLGPYS